MPILAELFIIFLLLLANGVFAMAEIAVVSARKARLKAVFRKDVLRGVVPNCGRCSTAMPMLIMCVMHQKCRMPNMIGSIGSWKHLRRQIRH